MKLLKPALTALSVGAIALSADAVIALRDVITVTNVNGETLQIKKIGDEALHFVTTSDGILLHESGGKYTYGRINANGIVESTGIMASNPLERKAKDLTYTTTLTDTKISELENLRGAAKRRLESFMPYEAMQQATDENMPKPLKAKNRAPQSGVGLSSSTYPSKGSTKGLIVLVQYSDVKFTHPDPAQYFGDMINKPGFNEYGGTGSALDYFTEQSNGIFTPSFDVYGPVTLSGTRATYGANDIFDDDVDPAGMVAEACKLLDDEVDFSQYDTDGDGLIDNVFVFYAGQGEASYGPDESIWPHSWDVRYGGQYVTLDGKTLAHYACSNEWERNRPDGIGTFVHEFSHVMGLPDLYNTVNSYDTSTPGSYSVLDYGPYNNDGCTPPNYGAYEKNALSWVEPIVLTQPETVNLKPIASGEFCLIPTSSKNEFFLLENRQLTGWDKYIPGHGMLIWHIDYNSSVFANNTVNNTKSHHYVDIEEANGSANSQNSTTMAGYTFPGTTGKTSFTSTTTPALKTWSKEAIDLPITEITESSDGIITFNVAGGGERLDTPNPKITYNSLQGRCFEASWEAVPEATDYLVTVYAKSAGEAGEVVVGFDGNHVPGEWNTNCSTWYNSAQDCGEAAPALKFSTDGNYLTSPIFNGDISEISFFIKGNGSNMTSKFYVKLGDGNSYTKQFYYQLEGNSYSGTGTLESEDIPEGTRQVQFKLSKTRGNVGLDDVTIKYGVGDQVLPDYNSASTSGELKIMVDKLKDDCNEYYFTIVSTDGVRRSAPTDPIYVTLGDTTGIDIPVTDADAETPRYFNLQGIEISEPQKGGVYILMQGNKATKVTF